MNGVNGNYVNAREKEERPTLVLHQVIKKLETCFVIPGLLVKRSRYNYSAVFACMIPRVLRRIYSLHPVANVITTFAVSREL